MRAALLSIPLALALGFVDDARRHGPASPDRGLPRADVEWAPYHADPDHALNRVARRLLLVELVPAHVGADLPRETSDEPLPEDWMLRWRDGAEADRRLFGGDGRQLPREGFDDAESRALREDLAAITDADVTALKERPALAVLFQHDLLRMVLRLENTERNAELVPPLIAAARGVALPPATLERLSAPVTADGPVDVDQTYQYRDEDYREVLRRSTRLFDASRTLLWSRTYLAHPEGHAALAQMVARAGGGEDVEVPFGMRGVLVQGVVALGADGEPHATQLMVDVRAQVLANRDPRGRENPTTSLDGVDFSILRLEREGLRRRGEPGVVAYRAVDDEDQDLFRDYGTLKHTTYRAQCALCHRVTNTPEPHLGGFPVLRPSAEPRFAVTGEERLRLAEEQVRGWLESLEQD